MVVKMNELSELCKPLVEFMKKNCSPHDTLIITDEHFKIVTDSVCVPIKKYGK